jgi:hypothetical protein
LLKLKKQELQHTPIEESDWVAFSVAFHEAIIHWYKTLTIFFILATENRFHSWQWAYVQQARLCGKLSAQYD